MKKSILYTLALLTLAFASCSKDAATLPGSADMGMLKMTISATRTETGGTYDPLDHILVQIYNAEGGLLRKYTALENIPQQLELLAGSYRVTVEAGERADASMEKRIYTGEKTFDVVAGQATRVEVVCKIVNTVVEVKFDESVTKNFGTNFYAWVVAATSVDETKAEAGEVPALRFTADGKGFFILPEGASTLAWKFAGTHNSRGEVVTEDVIQNVKASSKYQLTFRYSKDLPGFIDAFVVKVDTSTDDWDDTIIFSPDPTIVGDGFDMLTPQDYIPGKWTPRSYNIACLSATQSVLLSLGSETYSLLDADNTAHGITVAVESPTRLRVTLGEELFTGMPGGAYNLTFAIRDINNGALESASPYRLQGLLPFNSTDYDLWKNTVTLRAMVLDPAATGAQFGLRTQNGEWKQLDGAAAEDGIYSVTFAPEWTVSQNESGHTIHTPVANTGVFAANTYEYNVQIDGVQFDGGFSTPAGDGIYNAGMDLWTTYTVKGSSATGGTVSYPNETSNQVYWVGSNNKQTANLCLKAQPEGSNGPCCKLQPQIPSLADVFATGTLFTGTFECGTGLLDMFGYARFGIQYTYSARPRALKVRFNASINPANYAGGPLKKGDTDPARIMVCVTDWNGRHAVKSGKSFDESTFWDPIKSTSLGEGPILGYGSIMLTQSTQGWVSEEIPLHWYDKVSAPGAGKYSLVISCVSSAYGDYLAGSTSNILYVEDFEWVY